MGFACHSLGKQGFASPRRATKQHSFRDFAPQVSVLFGVFEKVHHFEDFVFGSVEASDVFECGFHRVVGVKHLRTALADVEDLATRPARTASAHAAH